MTTKSQARRLAVVCEPCNHADREGWWGDSAITHCRGCHTTWSLTKTRWQHCVRCHRTFGGDEAAVRHLDREGRCVDPATVLHKNGRRILTLNPDGVWVRVFGA